MWHQVKVRDIYIYMFREVSNRLSKNMGYGIYLFVSVVILLYLVYLQYTYLYDYSWSSIKDNTST